MIKSLVLRNFQSHKSSCLEFSSGVNIIVGPSDSGKTAIIRALRWLIWNRPQGEAFRSVWGGDTSVIIDVAPIEERLSAYNRLCRTRTNKGNEYGIYNTRLESGADLIYTMRAVGAEVPELVADALSMDEVNLQMQFDLHFLLSASPGEVSHHFNRIAHLDAIDRGLQSVQRGLRSLEQDIASGEVRLAELEEELSSYDYLDKLDGEVSVLEVLERQMRVTVLSSQKLAGTIKSARATEEQLAKHQVVTAAEVVVNSALDLFSLRRDADGRMRTLNRLVGRIEIVEESLAEHSVIMEAEADVDSVLEQLEKHQQATQEIVALSSAIAKLASLNKLLAQTDKDAKILEKEFGKVFPDVCPLCGKEYKHAK